MMKSRRTVLQLTPLLDLLLIVMFSQYMVIGSSAARHAAGEQERELARIAELDEARMTLLQLQQQLTLQQNELANRREHVEESADELQRLRAQQELIGQLLKQLFRVPDAVVDSLAKTGERDGPGLTPSDWDALRSRLKQLAENEGTSVVQHLLTFEELRKRADLWELHLQANGIASLNAGGLKHEFRVESAARFEQKLFEIYKSLPQVKGLVVVLVTYGDARFRDRQQMLDSLPRVLDRMREDNSGRARFEYAVLGYREQEPAKPDRP